MPEDTRGSSHARTFDEIALPHLDAAFNLARWLVRNAADAEDVVQEAYLRAFKSFGGYRGGDSRAWILKIVRNTSYTFLGKTRPADLAEEFDETVHSAEAPQADAETALLQSADGRLLAQALGELPLRFREVLTLRELEGLPYKEIADVMDVPIGTVMSSLARARAQLKERLLNLRGATGPKKEAQRGL
jgi:RNA polymerase sigma-70 factor, ECF subfamily